MGAGLRTLAATACVAAAIGWGVAVWSLGQADRPAPTAPVSAAVTSPATAAAWPAASAPVPSGPVAVPRDPGMRYRFELLGVVSQAAGDGAASVGRAWIAVDGQGARLVALNDELRPGIRLRQIEAHRVRIANDDSTMVWELPVTPPAGAAAVGRAAAPAQRVPTQLELQAHAAGLAGAAALATGGPPPAAVAESAQAAMLRAQTEPVRP